MKKASEVARLLGFCLAFLLLAAVLCFATGCTVAKSTQELPVTAGQVQAGQPNILQLQFFPAQSLNARPVHAEAAGQGAREGLPPQSLGTNWADTVNWSDVTIHMNVTVSSTGAATGQEAAQEGGVVSGAVTQTPTTDIKPTISTAVGPNASSTATGGEGVTGGDTPAPIPAPAPAPAPEPTPEPTPAPDPVSLHTLEDMMLAHLARSRRR